MRQKTFFDDEFASDMASKRGIMPSDPNVVPSDVRRLTGQNALILARLKQGPATSSELAALSLKYTSRISDLRAAGHDVFCERGEGGNNVYRLKDVR